MTDYATMESELSALDRAALQRCVDLTLAEPDQGRVEQVEGMLASNQTWLETALFCSFHRQIAALHLMPWELPPCSGGQPQADALADKLIKAGLSQFEPDPAEALRTVKARPDPRAGVRFPRAR